MTKEPINVAVTGAAGSISYSLLFRIGSGDMFGKDQPVKLQLIEIPPAMEALEGVVMELDDCAFPLVEDIQTTDDLDAGFRDANVCLLIGGKPRGSGMKRADLVEANGDIFTAQGRAINDNAADDVRIVTVANPCNTNALIAMNNAPDIPDERFTAMTRLDLNRAKNQLATKAGASVNDVQKVGIFGNHSDTMYPHFYEAEIDGQPATEAVSQDWLENDFIETVQGRGSAIIEARGQSSAASAANAVVDHIRSWYAGYDDWMSMAIPSDGSYGVEEGLVFSYPVRCTGGWDYEIIDTLELNDYAQQKLDITENQLKEERDVVSELL